MRILKITGLVALLLLPPLLLRADSVITKTANAVLSGDSGPGMLEWRITCTDTAVEQGDTLLTGWVKAQNQLLTRGGSANTLFLSGTAWYMDTTATSLVLETCATLTPSTAIGRKPILTTLATGITKTPVSFATAVPVSKWWRFMYVYTDNDSVAASGAMMILEIWKPN